MFQIGFYHILMHFVWSWSRCAGITLSFQVSQLEVQHWGTCGTFGSESNMPSLPCWSSCDNQREALRNTFATQPPKFDIHETQEWLIYILFRKLFWIANVSKSAAHRMWRRRQRANSGTVWRLSHPPTHASVIPPHWHSGCHASDTCAQIVMA